MARALIQFRVPHIITPLHGVLVDLGGESDDIDLTNHDMLSDVLMAAAGRLVEIRFDDEPDPLDVIFDLAKVLDEQNVRYWAVCDAHVEPSRGDRFLGRVLFNVDGKRTDLKIPFEYGEPQLAYETLVAAGMDREAAMAIEKVMTSDPGSSPAPR